MHAGRGEDAALLAADRCLIAALCGELSLALPRRYAGSFGTSPVTLAPRLDHSQTTGAMIRTDAGYKNAQEKLDQEQETLQWQREQLEEMDLSDEEARWQKMVIRILPNMGSAWRLIRAVLAEEHWEWSTGRKCLDMAKSRQWKERAGRPEPNPKIQLNDNQWWLPNQTSHSAP